MPHSPPAILAVSRAVLRVLLVLNLVCLLLFVLVLGASFLFEEQALKALAERGGETRAGLLGAARILVAIGILAVPLAHLILSRLLALVDTVRAGEPFASGNAGRLQAIAWALLGIQLLDLACGAVAMSVATDDPLGGWSPSVTGWLAVLLLFVLARVFAEGARLRDELEGTV